MFLFEGKFLFKHTPEGRKQRLESSGVSPERDTPRGRNELDRQRQYRVITPAEFARYEDTLAHGEKIQDFLDRIPDYEEIRLTEGSHLGDTRELLKGTLKALREYDIRNGTHYAKQYADEALRLYNKKDRGTLIDNTFSSEDFLELTIPPQHDFSWDTKSTAYNYEVGARVSNFLDTLYSQWFATHFFHSAKIDDKEGNFDHWENDFFDDDEIGYIYGILALAGILEKENKITYEQHREYVEYAVPEIQKFRELCLRLNARKREWIEEGMPKDEVERTIKREKKLHLHRILSPDQFFGRKKS